MLGPPKLRRLDRPIGRSIEELVSRDDFYRHLEKTLDLGFVREWVADCYAERGRPGIDPVVFFKLQLVMFFEGVRSERQLMRVVADRLSVRWYLGYDFDEPLPDHSSLTRIRTRLGLPIFQRFFEHVVELCRDVGLVWGKELFFDATKVNADADFDSLTPRWYLRAKGHLDELFPEDGVSEPSAQPGEEPVRAPFAGDAVDERRLERENRSRWRLLERLRLDPQRPQHRGYQRKADLRVSTTDPDAAPIQTGVKPTLGYRDHYVVDGGRARIILAAVALPGDVMDQTAMPDLLHRVRFRWRLRPRRAVADALYGTTENMRALEEAGIRAYLPVKRYADRTPFFSQHDFTYDAERDEYRCAAGHSLRWDRDKLTEGATVYRADPATCNACPLKASCTDSDRGRIVHRPFFIDLIERVKAYAETDAFKRAMRKRQVWVEPLFGEAKQWHNLRRFRLRRLWRVNCEALLVAAGQNLKRWLSRTGWGRRYGPCGSLALSPSVLALSTFTTPG
jgi:transposase